MQELYGQCRGAMVVLHGGAGGQDPKAKDSVSRATAALNRIAAAAVIQLSSGASGAAVVGFCLKELELDEQFNAGRGSALQADGQARLTAAVMDGSKQTFSGVISAIYSNHPSTLALHLQSCEARVLTVPGTELLARQLGLPVESALTPERVERWVARAATKSFCDTVGCLVRLQDGSLYAGTSTGGRGYEFPGRVSDSGTVAGTYASGFAAISATGVGEEIVDDAVAARLETRRRDGASLEAASRSCLREAQERQRAYGWIALDKDGFWAVAHTTPAMSFAVHSATAGEVASCR